MPRYAPSDDLTWEGKPRIRNKYTFSVEERAEHFGAIHNYILVSPKERDGKYRIQCTKCGKIRETNRLHGPRKCECSVLRLSPWHILSPKEVTEYLRSHGHTSIRCTAVEDLPSKRNGMSSKRYTIECVNGHTFTRKSLGKVRNWGYSCPQCRDEENLYNRRTHKTVDDLKKFLQGLGLEYVWSEDVTLRSMVRYKNPKCGHISECRIGNLPKKKEYVPTCRTCCPKAHGLREVVKDGKYFRLRSRAELRFLEELLERGYSVDEITYEPQDGKVQYKCPISGKIKTYTPDFKVRNTFVEVKDVNSLGVGGYYPWQDAEQALLVNRAKSIAARRALGKFKTFCLVRIGDFHLTERYWMKQERNRLRQLNRRRVRNPKYHRTLKWT